MIGRYSCVLAVILLSLSAADDSLAADFIQSARITPNESASEVGASIEIRFNCKVHYERHAPQSSGDVLRIYLDPTSICNGVSPEVARSRTLLRPFNADAARLVDLEYDGGSTAGPVLTLSFSEPVTFDVDMSRVSFGLTVHVGSTAVSDATSGDLTVLHRQVERPKEEEPDFAVNLASFRRVPTSADAPGMTISAGQRLYYSEFVLNGTTWYRLRVGDFESANAANVALGALQVRFPGAWIGTVETTDNPVELQVTTGEVRSSDVNVEQSNVDTLMEDARKSMAADEISRAVQIYTKVLQLPENSRQAEAQEYLALAREKKGQMAHAKAEYQRYLSLYPEGDGAARVRQRLAALLASDPAVRTTVAASNSKASGRESRLSDWRLQTYFSQYYRRDANQLNDEDEVISQSALYSDINFDARRRGERFDFSSRLSAGYRNSFLDEGTGSGDDLRISYAYADLADASTGLRGRIGRQSRNTGGVLGRFDGVNVGYEASERILINAVAGKPAYSASDGIDSARTFYGASVKYGPVLDNLELGLYYIQQDIESLDDRQAVGAEFRYFGDSQSIWGLVDYDTLYNELGSAFLQASWRLGSRLTLHGSFDRRHSPFLSTGNALIGQPVLEFAELLELLPVAEIKDLAVDRSPLSTTYTLGVSHSLTPKLQINADVNETTVDATPDSGGVAATPASTYRYYATSLVASSLLKEGDVTILGARYSDSGTSRVTSFTIDSRYPFGRTWRINPRLRVDRRERAGNPDDEWVYTPAIRVQYRRSQKFRIELEAGKQFSQRDTPIASLDRESYYINIGYQSFF